MRTRLSIVTAVLVAAGAPLASTATSGGNRVAEIACGAEISSNVTFQHDLTCPGEGIILTNSNPITVNLNRHGIRGSGGGTGVELSGLPATVKNGTITGFGTGIEGINGINNAAFTLSRLTVSRNYQGIHFNADLLLTDSNVVENFTDGAAADGDDCGVFNQSFGVCHATVNRTTFARHGQRGLLFGLTIVWSVSNSRFIANGSDGLVAVDSFGSVSNSAESHNGGDGINILITPDFNIDPNDPGPPVVQNTAIGNRNWGIEYTIRDADGTVRTVPADFGVNVARGNGQPGQCIGIVCVPSA